MSDYSTNHAFDLPVDAGEVIDRSDHFSEATVAEKEGFDCAGTVGTWGSAGGSFGTVGTFGCCC